MPAVKKSELLEKLRLNEKQQQEYDALEKLINDYLIAHYVGDPISVPLTSAPSDKVQLAIKREFTQNGGFDKVEFYVPTSFQDAPSVELE